MAEFVKKKRNTDYDFAPPNKFVGRKITSEPCLYLCEMGGRFCLYKYYLEVREAVSEEMLVAMREERLRCRLSNMMSFTLALSRPSSSSTCSVSSKLVEKTSKSKLSPIISLPYKAPGCDRGSSLVFCCCCCCFRGFCSGRRR